MQNKIRIKVGVRNSPFNRFTRNAIAYIVIIGKNTTDHEVINCKKPPVTSMNLGLWIV